MYIQLYYPFHILLSPVLDYFIMYYAPSWYTGKCTYILSVSCARLPGAGLFDCFTCLYSMNICQ